MTIPERGADWDSIGDSVNLINSLYNTAKIDMKIIDFVICREEGIGFSSDEDYEKELLEVNSDGINDSGSRYLVAMTVRTEGREIQTYTRFNRSSDKAVKFEKALGDTVSVASPKEIEKPELWDGAIKTAVFYAPHIIQLILQVLSKID